MIPVVFLGLGLAASFPGNLAEAQDANKEKTATASETSESKEMKKDAVAEESNKATSGLVAIANFIPLGQEQRDVRFPSFDRGRMASVIDAKTMKRLDDERLEMTTMVITTYDETGDKEMTVSMPAAIYNLASGVLASDKRSKVERADFEIEGDAMLFDTGSQHGKMTGNVRMIIHDSSAIGPLGGAKSSDNVQ